MTLPIFSIASWRSLIVTSARNNRSFFDHVLNHGSIFRTRLKFCSEKISSVEMRVMWMSLPCLASPLSKRRWVIDFYAKPSRRCRTQTRAVVRPQKARGKNRQRWNSVWGLTCSGLGRVKEGRENAAQNSCRNCMHACSLIFF